ncbi:MAG: class I SAM-dependent methyltransferase [Gemmatimonadetes bacterium]|nr:class I SAM-dependent methyltransferase [Gemmatimonadota bacterium]
MSTSPTPRPEMSESQLEFLTGLIASQNLPGPHLEVGTAYGLTLARMILALPSRHEPVFVVVDNMRYFPDQMATVRANLERSGIDPDSVEFRIGDSGRRAREAAKAGDSFDFILIDASHKVRKVTGDLRWTRILRPGGVVCLHDYHPDFPGVVRSVDRFLARNPNYERIGQVSSLLALRKTGPGRRPEISAADRAWAAFRHARVKLGLSS